MKKVLKAIRNYLHSTPAHVYVIAAALLLLIATVVTAGVVFGKYTTEDRIYGTLEVSNRLATRFALQEHEAVQQENGSYALDSDSLVTTNTYELIPGLTIPKDPYISIENKTTIPAFLYVEVVPDSISPAVSYSVNTALWQLLTGVTGPHGGQVYTYYIGPVDDQTAGLSQIPILTGNSFSIPPLPITGTRECLTFYGYLIEQTSASATAAATFTGSYS